MIRRHRLDKQVKEPFHRGQRAYQSRYQGSTKLSPVHHMIDMILVLATRPALLVSAALLILALPALCNLPDGYSYDGNNADTLPAPEIPAEQCFRFIEPRTGYALTLEDHVSMSVTLRINCPGLGAISHLRVDNDSPYGGHWWGLQDLQELGYMEHDELFTIELSYLKRGTSSLAFSLLRLGCCLNHLDSKNSGAFYMFCHLFADVCAGACLRACSGLARSLSVCVRVCV